MSSDEVSEPRIEAKHDRRFLDMGEYEAHVSLDAAEQQTNRRIQAVHCRLLEAATAGRLTWDGDRIVARVPAPTNAGPHQGTDLIKTTAAEKSCYSTRH